jgi:hypothetical protein
VEVLVPLVDMKLASMAFKKVVPGSLASMLLGMSLTSVNGRSVTPSLTRTKVLTGFKKAREGRNRGLHNVFDDIGWDITEH